MKFFKQLAPDMNCITSRGSYILPLIFIFFISLQTNGQGCLNSVEFGSFDASTLNVTPEVISTCTFLGDYSVITNVVPDSHLKFELPAGGYVTIRVGSPDGFLVGFGNNYAIAYNASGEDLYVHWNVNSSCLTDEINCRTSTIQCLNCNGCVAPNLGVSVDLATSFGPFQGTLSNCNLVGEYNEITGIPSI